MGERRLAASNTQTRSTGWEALVIIGTAPRLRPPVRTKEVARGASGIVGAMARAA